jgi:hypothetical protein
MIAPNELTEEAFHLYKNISALCEIEWVIEF